ncbi:hypothetical protein R6Q59_035155 [Mikania micrantha]
MPASATMIGALLGLGTQMYSNALRKLPYMRHPWEHVLGMGLGAVFANQLVKWDAKLQQDLDKMLDKAKAANERRYFAITLPLVPPYATATANVNNWGHFIKGIGGSPTTTGIDSSLATTTIDLSATLHSNKKAPKHRK